MRSTAVLLLCLCGAVTPLMAVDDDVVSTEDRRLFESEVRPVLIERCGPCHGAEAIRKGRPRGELRVDGREALLRGGRSGPAIVPGRPRESLLVQAVRRLDSELSMPPGKALSERTIRALEEWVRRGALWPSDSSSDDPRQPFRITAKDREYWAFRPLVRPDVPRETRSAPAANPVDRFLFAKLHARGLVPSREASRRELVRRLFFDVLGLPPTPEDVAAFVSNDAPLAYETLVDRLLARPEFGERWGRHWLDVARFAQTNGYERDDEKLLSWRYRDYVVRSFNADKPFHRFVREQIAGDEYEQFDADGIVATGFYRLGVWDDEPDDKLAAEYDGLDDMVRATGAAFLGLTVGCARCHDHMYDPISQQDYYNFLSFLHNVRTYELPKLALESATYSPLMAPAALEKWLRDVEPQVAELRLERKSATDEEKRSIDDRIAKLTASPSGEWALSVRELGAQPRATHVLLRGDPRQRGAEALPAVPEVLSSGMEPAAVKASARSSGRRRVLAEWMASPRNPLVPRVLVNRIWQHYFGRGIVRTPNDFGKAGLPPTHPELLDYLAAEFVAGGTLMKPLHRLLLTSQAYRMSSRGAADVPGRTGASEVDPGNDLFWRQNPRRLEAEAIRDAVLVASGTLNTHSGGRGFFPHIEGEVVAGASKPGRGWGRSTAAERSRRSLYAFVKRTLRVPFLETFDYVNTAQPLGARAVTTVAPQALLLLNDRFLQDRALAFADRVRREVGADPHVQIERAFELALSRRPTQREVALALDSIVQERRSLDAQRPALDFVPDAARALEKGYLDRTLDEELLRPPRGWRSYRGRWDDRGDNIHWVDLDESPFALFEGLPFSKGTVSATLRLERGAEFASVLVGSTADGSRQAGYEIRLEPEREHVSLRRHGDGVRVLAEAPYPVARDVWHTVRVQLEGRELRLWMDEAAEATLSATDAERPAAGGHLGVRVWGAPLRIRRLAGASDGGAFRVAAQELSARQKELRALAGFCLVLFNLNEFVYVD